MSQGPSPARAGNSTSVRREVVVSISVAARRSGLHVQTLRLYERRGLLAPQRTPGGARRYSDRDIARLARITELSAAGVGLSGIATILELEARLAAAEAEIGWLRTRLGQRAQRPGRGTVTRHG